ncbi:MAG: hypothetical protein ACOXZ6_10930 [Syntrophomonadaceae bacterium]|nr:hypothetical protein [Syntrophomonadaceae bacterium]
MRVDSAKHIAKGKGVLGDEESEGSRRQTSGLTNTHRAQAETTSGMCKLGKAAKQAEAQNYPEAYGVNVADRWKERLRSYPGRSHGRVETE